MSVEYVTKIDLVECLAPICEQLKKLDGFATKEDLKGFAIKEDLKAFATKEDLRGFATKEDLKAFATKEDLKGFATKEDLKAFATKEDFRNFPTREEMQKAIGDALEPVHRHIDTALEQFKSEVRLLAEGHASVDKGQSKLKRYMEMRLDQQDARIDRLDAKLYLLTQRFNANGDSTAAAKLALSASTQA